MNYIAAATMIDPTVTFLSFSSKTDPYESLVWAGTPIPKAELEAAWLQHVKNTKIQELAAAMQVQVLSGFLSDALVPGTMRKYDSDVQGQVAVVGALTLMQNHIHENDNIVGPESFTLSSVDPATGVRSYHPYSYSQAHKLLVDLGSYAESFMSTLTSKIGQVMMINTGNTQADLDAVRAISW